MLWRWAGRGQNDGLPGVMAIRHKAKPEEASLNLALLGRRLDRQWELKGSISSRHLPDPENLQRLRHSAARERCVWIWSGMGAAVPASFPENNNRAARNKVAAHLRSNLSSTLEPYSKGGGREREREERRLDLGPFESSAAGMPITKVVSKVVSKVSDVYLRYFKVICCKVVIVFNGGVVFFKPPTVKRCV